MRERARSREEAVVRQLQEKYEKEGYQYFAYPGRDIVPSFLGAYRPDAIALRSDRNVAIEVETARSGSQNRLETISRLFQSHPEWNFRVIAVDDHQPEFLSPSNLSQLRSALEEARAAAESGHLRAALLLSWGVLEGAARLSAPGDNGVLGPRQVIQSLTSEGWLDQQTSRKLRDLVPLRNAIVHGDYSLSPSAEQSTILLEAASIVLEELGTRPH